MKKGYDSDNYLEGWLTNNCWTNLKLVGWQIIRIKDGKKGKKKEKAEWNQR